MHKFCKHIHVRPHAFLNVRTAVTLTRMSLRVDRSYNGAVIRTYQMIKGRKRCTAGHTHVHAPAIPPVPCADHLAPPPFDGQSNAVGGRTEAGGAVPRHKAAQEVRPVLGPEVHALCRYTCVRTVIV